MYTFIQAQDIQLNEGAKVTIEKIPFYATVFFDKGDCMFKVRINATKSSDAVRIDSDENLLDGVIDKFEKYWKSKNKSDIVYDDKASERVGAPIFKIDTQDIIEMMTKNI